MSTWIVTLAIYVMRCERENSLMDEKEIEELALRFRRGIDKACE